MVRISDIVCDDDRGTAIIPINKNLFTKSAVLRACYWFGKDFTFRLDEEADTFIVRMQLRTVIPTLEQPKVEKVSALIHAFSQALLDYQLHMEIQAETAPIRELIVAKAFAESGILEDPPPGTFEDPVEAATRKSKTLVQIAARPASD